MRSNVNSLPIKIMLGGSCIFMFLRSVKLLSDKSNESGIHFIIGFLTLHQAYCTGNALLAKEPASKSEIVQALQGPICVLASTAISAIVDKTYTYR